MTFLMSTKSYGFRAGRSTQQAILELIDNVSVAIESNEYTIGIFWDLSKAFDTVNHVILLHKRQHYGLGEMHWNGLEIISLVRDK